jgi:hypothetical protein
LTAERIQMLRKVNFAWSVRWTRGVYWYTRCAECSQNQKGAAETRQLGG